MLQTFRELIGSSAWQLLLAEGMLRSYSPGQAILRQGDPGGFLLALDHGRAKLLASATDGAQLLLTVRGAGQLLGELAGDEGLRTATVEAMDRCTAYYLSTAQFDRFIAKHRLGQEFHRYVTGKFDQAVSRQVDLAHRSALRRIARLLHDTAVLAPSTAADPMRVPFTQEELAGSLGLARSTVADQLTTLRAAGALTRGPHLVVADLDRLAAVFRV
ncbi:Crp/Fnr family transcriptional regulator [Kribbella sandramycini]|uniref:CRP-like cAMP-binding protein n=1 Tax=Kribbella sandramycini TaxID=60450 RepID=A0A7Y4L3G2_9ACTN|nr:Crp/Fnr family transcriptional regulator [Kribbella sandramycini]MBB6570497.1 CRP-like cAMP-binding protein [Kribbella sandramycini]NOL43643.1 Crp/Fnr family transcriptional regulator [Kribbella sandramycini]